MSPTAYEIFSYVKFPQHTYVTRSEDYETKVEKCLKRGQIAFIHGPSRIGKTVLAKRLIPHHEDVISAENFQSANDLWRKVAQELNISKSKIITKEIVESNRRSINYFAKIIAWFSAEAGIEGNIETGQDQSKSVAVSKNPSIPREYAKLKRTLVIDNFHFIRPSVQIEILKTLKGIIEKSSAFPIIIIATTNDPDYLTNLLADISMQYTPITLEPWSYDDLQKIANLGFPKLNATLTPLLSYDLATESRRVPALMQAMCLEIALQLNLKKPAEEFSPAIGKNDVDLYSIYKEAADSSNRMGDYSKLIRYALQLSEIKKKVTLMAIRNIKNNISVTYQEALIQALVSENEATLSVKELANIFDSITIKDTNNIDMVAVLESLDHAAQKLFEEKINRKPASDTIDVPLISWDEQLATVSIQDPKFAFYLRWSGQLTNILE